MKYAKYISEREIEYAPKNKGGVSNYNQDAEKLAADGYLPVLETPRPEGGNFTLSYKKEAEQIKLVWTEETASIPHEVDVPAENTQADVDFVVESYLDADGNWYRQYKSGWVEQGGCGKGTITFLKPYSAPPNVMTGSANKTVDGWPARANEVTATGFYLYGGNQDTLSAYWEAKGQGGENV
ncbi:MAG: hypothetical protein J6J74_02235 [Elusimicrobiaceae bacterium]|nr:hypothetical protein [Elusimicrobiaceae bacterium]